MIQINDGLTKAEIAAKPFIKWAGGKQQLLTQFDLFFPDTFNRYFEPFLGGGAVFFHLWKTNRLSQEAYLFDHNHLLITTYRAVQNNLPELLEILAPHKSNHSKEYYYKIRILDRVEDPTLTEVEQAARMIYLNKTCFNGLFRVNSKGQFNVPIGSYKRPSILEENKLKAANIALQDAQLQVRKFTELLNFAQAGDFIYFDPPYHPVSETASFTSYTASDFGNEDQQRLAEVFTELTRRGCLCMLSNSYTPFIRELYQDFRMEIVQANRAINSKGNGRGSVKELVVLNY